MKILIINLDKSIFRPNSRSAENLKDYSRFFDKLFVISWTREKKQPIYFENKLFIYPTNSKSRLFYISDTYKIFKKHIEADKIDLISSQDPFETGLAAFLISRKYKIPLHLQAHTDFLSPYFWKESLLNKIRVLLAKFLIPRAKCIRVVSERIKRSLSFAKDPSKNRLTPFASRMARPHLRFLRGTFTSPRISVLPIFVDVKKIQESPVKTDLHKKYLHFNFIILMASRLTREKNIGLAIEVMPEIIKKHPKTGLVIVGEGPERKNLESRIRNLELGENIIIEGWADNMISYYKTADLFLLTSNYEGYGMAVIEAMASGCPVIMTDVGLAGEVLVDKKDGLVVPVKNKKKLTEAILSLIKNADLRKNLTENAKKILSLWPTKEEYLRAYRESWADSLIFRSSKIKI